MLKKVNGQKIYIWCSWLFYISLFIYFISANSFWLQICPHTKAFYQKIILNMRIKIK